MEGIFLSYRREDSSGYAGRVYDRLSQHFGEDQLFMDIDTLKPGVDFVEVLERAVGSCDVLIALIGKQWLTVTDEQMGITRNAVNRWCMGSNPIPLWAKKFVDLLVEVQRLRGLDQWVKEALTNQPKKKPRSWIKRIRNPRHHHPE